MEFDFLSTKRIAMKKLTYSEAIEKYGGPIKNNCDNCNKVIAFEPLSSLKYAEKDKNLFVFCSGRCRSNMIKNLSKGDV